MRILLGVVLVAFFVVAGMGEGWAQAPNCTTGKPCGNSCIARDRVCRIGTSSGGSGSSSNSDSDFEGDPNWGLVLGITFGSIAAFGLLMWLVAEAVRPDPEDLSGFVPAPGVFVDPFSQSGAATLTWQF